MTAQEINEAIKKLSSAGEISDGYHTFDELYEHRCRLFIALIAKRFDGWKSKKHSDGTSWDGWFICGCGEYGKTQITYHLPMRLWDNCLTVELDKAKEWDGHTSSDVLERLLEI